MDAELRAEFEALRRHFDQHLDQRLAATAADLRQHTDASFGTLRQELADTATDLRQHTDASVAGLRKHTDESIAALREHTDGSIADLRQHTDGSIAALRREMAAEGREIRRHFDVVAEGLRGEIWLLAEGFGLVDRLETRLREELHATRRDLEAMIRLAYADLDRRLRVLEVEVADLRRRAGEG